MVVNFHIEINSDMNVYFEHFTKINTFHVLMLTMKPIWNHYLNMVLFIPFKFPLF